MIRALLLDLDNTIADRDGAVRAWLEHVRPPGVDEARFSIERLATEDGGGHGDRRPFWRALSAALGISATAARARFRREIADHFRERPEATELLARFPGPIVVLTNGDTPLQRRKVRALGLSRRVEAVLFAREHGGEKPLPGVFQAALRHARAAPPEALMVGDHPIADVGGARALGIPARLLRTRWFTPPPDVAVIEHLGEITW